MVRLHAELGASGLEILAFPCNQFGMQEPGGAAEVEACVRAKYAELEEHELTTRPVATAHHSPLTTYHRYHVDFHVFEKVKVNGADTHPVYQLLKQSEANNMRESDQTRGYFQRGFEKDTDQGRARMVPWNWSFFVVGRDRRLPREQPFECSGSVWPASGPRNQGVVGF